MLLLNWISTFYFPALAHATYLALPKFKGSTSGPPEGYCLISLTTTLTQSAFQRRITKTRILVHRIDMEEVLFVVL